MAIEFTKPDDGWRAVNAPKQSVIQFRNVNTGEEMTTVVVDKFPLMGDVHIEGRHAVELSVELFVELVAGKGYYPVDPRTGQIAVPVNEEPADAPTEEEDA